MNCVLCNLKFRCVYEYDIITGNERVKTGAAFSLFFFFLCKQKQKKAVQLLSIFKLCVSHYKVSENMKKEHKSQFVNVERKAPSLCCTFQRFDF